MAEFTKLSFKKGEMNAALAGLFKDMIEKGAVEAVLSPSACSSKGVMQTLITDPEKMGMVDPFAPVVPVNSAKIAVSMTAKPSGRPVAMVMRSCEVRALVELVKLKQANLEDVILIGLDCLGRYENEDFLKFQEKGGTAESFLETAQSGETASSGFDITEACKICEHPVADNVDLRLCTVGSEPDAVYVEWVTEKGQAVREKMGQRASGAPSKRTEAVSALTKARTDARDQRFSEFRESTNIPPTTLSDRLKRLVEHGMIEKRRYQEKPPRDEFVLTKKGRDFWPVMLGIAKWGDRYDASGEGAPPMRFVSRQTGDDVQLKLHCGNESSSITPSDIRAVAGPAADDKIRWRLEQARGHNQRRREEALDAR